MDRSGTRVETLLMAGGNNAPSANAGPAPPQPPPRPERGPGREAPAREALTADDPFQEEAEGEEEQVPADTARPVVPHGKPSEAPPPTQGVYLPAPGADYPTSVFAPRPPAPEPSKPAPKPESTPPPFNP
jgi:hypothetical protein